MGDGTFYVEPRPCSRADRGCGGMAWLDGLCQDCYPKYIPSPAPLVVSRRMAEFLRRSSG